MQYSHHPRGRSGYAADSFLGVALAHIEYHTKSQVNPYVCNQWSKTHPKVANMGQNPPKVAAKDGFGTSLGQAKRQVYIKRWHVTRT